MEQVLAEPQSSDLPLELRKHLLEVARMVQGARVRELQQAFTAAARG